MLAFLRAALFALVALIVIAFALCNRDPVALTLNPLGDPVMVPLFLVGLGSLAIGFMAGAALLWTRTLALRFAARRQSKRIASLERDLEATDPALEHVPPALPARNAYGARL